MLRIRTSFYRLFQSRDGLEFPLGWLLAIGVTASLAAGFLVANDLWPIAFGMLAALPAFVILHRYPWSAVLIWVIVSPFLIFTDSNLLRRVFWVVHRGLPFLTLVIMAVSNILRIQKRSYPKLGLPDWLFLGYVIATFLSILFQSSSTSTTAILAYDRIFSPFCLYLIVRLVAPRGKDMNYLIWGAVFIAFTQTVFGLMYWSVPGLLPSGWPSEAPRATGSVRSVGLYTCLLLFAGLLLLHAGMNARVRWKKFLFLGLFGFSYLGVLLSFSRGSWLAGLVVLAALFAMYPRFIIRLFVIGGAAIIFLAGSLLSEQIELARERLNSEHTALSRLPVMFASVQMFAARPAFGWGYGNFDDYDRQFQGRVGDLVNPDEKNLSSHNFYLSRLAEQGLIGVGLYAGPTLWLLFLTFFLFRSGQFESASDKNFLILLWLVLLNIFIVHNFLDMILFLAHGLWWLTVALIAVRIETIQKRNARWTDFMRAQKAYSV